MSIQEYIDVNTTTLEEWLALVFNPPPNKVFLRVAFPTDTHRQEYLKTIQYRSDEEVYRLLSSFLIRTGSMGFHDEIALESLIKSKESDPDLHSRQIERHFWSHLLQRFFSHNQIHRFHRTKAKFDLARTVHFQAELQNLREPGLHLDLLHLAERRIAAHLGE